MSRPDTDGFSVMDVSTAILDDEKFQRLALIHPELYAPAVVGFVSTLARSWRKGRRVAVIEAWPVYRPLDEHAIAALVEVHLLDKTGRITTRSWREWFEVAANRRDNTRERNRKAKQAERGRQRGVSDDATSVSAIPTVRSSPTVPTNPSTASAVGRAGSGPTRFADLVPRPPGYPAKAAAGG